MKLSILAKHSLLAVFFLAVQLSAFFLPDDRLALLASTAGIIICLVILSLIHTRSLARNHALQQRNLEAIRDMRAKQSQRELEILDLIRDSRLKQSRKEYEIIEMLRNSTAKRSKKELEIQGLIQDSRLKQSRKEYQILMAVEGLGPRFASLRSSLDEVKDRFSAMEQRDELKDGLLNRGLDEQRETVLAEERRAQQAIRRLFGAVLEGQNRILTHLEGSQLEQAYKDER